MEELLNTQNIQGLAEIGVWGVVFFLWAQIKALKTQLAILTEKYSQLNASTDILTQLQNKKIILLGDKVIIHKFTTKKATDIKEIN